MRTRVTVKWMRVNKLHNKYEHAHSISSTSWDILRFIHRRFETENFWQTKFSFGEGGELCKLRRICCGLVNIEMYHL